MMTKKTELFARMIQFSFQEAALCCWTSAPAAASPQLSGVSPVGDKDLQDQGLGAGQKPVDVTKSVFP